MHHKKCFMVVKTTSFRAWQNDVIFNNLHLPEMKWQKTVWFLSSILKNDIEYRKIFSLNVKIVFSFITLGIVYFSTHLTNPNFSET